MYVVTWFLNKNDVVCAFVYITFFVSGVLIKIIIMSMYDFK